jgi:hypothetical protein
MPGEPPDRGDTLDEVLTQVQRALDEAGVTGATLQGALLEGVRQAMETLEEPAPADGRPRMTVVDGGRGRGAGEPPEEPEEPRVRVKVLRSAATEGEAPRRRADVGQVWLDGEGCTQQTLFHGAAARAYRVHLERGRARLSLDGMPAEEIAAGQSVDVEAALIRLSAAEPVRGHYLRL